MSFDPAAHMIPVIDCSLHSHILSSSVPIYHKLDCSRSTSGKRSALNSFISQHILFQAPKLKCVSSKIESFYAQLADTEGVLTDLGYVCLMYMVSLQRRDLLQDNISTAAHVSAGKASTSPPSTQAFF